MTHKKCRLTISKGTMALVVVVTLFYAWAAEALRGANLHSA